jgi:hypothetical protein
MRDNLSPQVALNMQPRRMQMVVAKDAGALWMDGLCAMNTPRL